MGEIGPADRIRDLIAQIRQPGASPSEAALGRLLFRGPDYRYGLLLRQLLEAERIVRRYPRHHAFLAVVRFVPDELLFRLDLDEVISDALAVRDEISGAELRFRAIVRRGGVLSHIEGTTVGSPVWPKDWRIADRAIDATGQVLHLPRLEIVRAAEGSQRRALEQWLGAPLPETVRLNAPATDPELAAFAEREGVALPHSYRELLLRSNGVALGELEILGTGGAYRLDIPAHEHIVIAWVRGEVDDGVLLVDAAGDSDVVTLMAVHDREARGWDVAESVNGLMTRALAGVLQADIDRLLANAVQ